MELQATISKQKLRVDTRTLVMCGVFTALSVAGAFIRVDVPGTAPFTLQTLMVFLSGIFLGRKGVFSQAAYVLLGLVGLPVFSGGGGLGYVLQPSFGYLVGFVAGAFVTGMLAERSQQSFWKLFLASATGLFVLYAFGAGYMFALRNLYLGKPIGAWNALYAGAIIYLPKDLATCLAAAWVGKRLLPMVGHKEKVISQEK